ncbi:MAG TPA: competence/damage-inducible protein A [Bacillota bacterium]|nr:competence/damage-inducible protein A [Bacillota bacterium]HOA16052.1 competence/damage-inducible protein A [Bacillota bacterium]HOG52694.1 competence/damage-inducible protein A [Bacillota bacterium]
MGKVSCEIICVGTEILLGDIVNTNAQYISKGLAQIGLDTYFQTVVGDNPERLAGAIEVAKSRADVLIFTGGLGPTYDDLTKETVAKSFGRRLVMDEKCLEELTSFFTRNNRPMTDNNRKQAMMPEGAIVLANPQGTAPGCIIEGAGGKVAVLMPGPPREMQPMFDNLVKPYLRRFSDEVLVSRVVRVIGIGESAMEDRLIDMMRTMTNPTIAPYAKTGECILRVTAKAKNEKDAYALIEPLIQEIRLRLGEHVYGVDIDSLEEHIVGLLAKGSKTVAFAEAGTGGAASQRISSVPGSENVMKAGLTSSTLKGLACAMGIKDSCDGDKACDLLLPEIAGRIRLMAGSDIGVGILSRDCFASFFVTDGVNVEYGSMNYPASRSRDFLNAVAVNRALDKIRSLFTAR